MKRHIFTEEERAILLKNKHVAKVTAHTVSFAPTFKKFAVAESVEKGRRPQDIFITEGVPVAIIGGRIPERLVAAWRAIVTTRGIEALEKDGRGHHSPRVGRKKKSLIDESTMSDKEIIEYYKAKCAYTEAENAFLARTRGIPRMPPFEYRPGSGTNS
jgi:hypothetical protein